MTAPRERAAGHGSRRDVILDCAARLFAEHGYENTSLSDLAEAAQIAKATLFHYFDTKEKILFELYTRAVGTALETVQSVAPDDDPEVELRSMLREHALVIMENMRLYQIFFGEERGLLPDHLDTIRSQQVSYLNLVADRVTAMQRDGRVSPLVHPRVAAQVMLGIGSWTYRWFESSGSVTKTAIADFAAERRFTVCSAPAATRAGAAGPAGYSSSQIAPDGHTLTA